MFAGVGYSGDMRDPRDATWLAILVLQEDRLKVTRLEATGRHGLQNYLRDPDRSLMDVEAIEEYYRKHQVSYERITFAFKGPKNIGIVSEPPDQPVPSRFQTAPGAVVAQAVIADRFGTEATLS